jgi:hypothetical protein
LFANWGFFLLFCQKLKIMHKSILAAFVSLIIMACNEKKATKNLQITGNIKGLKSGILYIQKVVDTSLVAIDTIKIDGNSSFNTEINIDSPEMLYLSLNRGITKSIDNDLPFFAEKGKINIETDLEFFYANAKITGSKNQDLYNEFKKVNSRFNDQALDLTAAKFKALKAKNQFSMDSISKIENNNIRRKYLYAVNFALNHRDFEVSPFVALAEIRDVNLKYLDTIQKSLSPKVAKSLYGKKLIQLYEERKKLETKLQSTN